VVGDAGQIALAAAVGDLVAADRDQTVQPRVIEVIGDDARDDRADRVPRDPEQPGDRRLGHLLREERHEVLEVARVAGPGARPAPAQAAARRMPNTKSGAARTQSSSGWRRGRDAASA
jgi:hypothetical protein